MVTPHQQVWRVGQLKDATGLSVRTFHHYDQIGLLRPSSRTSGGHRLYSADDVRRLSLIVILRRAGLSLSKISEVLAEDSVDVAALIERQTSDLESALIDTVAFGRRLLEAPIDEVISDPEQIRELSNWVAPNLITVQPLVFLVYADVDRAHRSLVDMFGFGPGEISGRADGTAQYAEVTGPTGNIRLHGVRPGLQAPDPEVDPSSMTVVGVSDVVAHFDHARAAGAEIVRPVTSMFGMLEYTAYDLEHHLWCFQQPES